MRRRVIPSIGGIAALLMALDFSISGFVRPRFAVAWGIVVAICAFRTEIGSRWRESRVNLPPQFQFALAVLLVLVAVITTRWSAIERQDARQWGLVAFIALPLCWRGLAWAGSHLTQVVTSGS